ncbi:ABC transporter permease [Desulfoscipio sp. XC116]|uniref:ABC transporter permease n=1 Tax=Desulfoscipio sp. XC116 TaxID=3144975 RepID=UPI00325A7650
MRAKQWRYIARRIAVMIFSLLFVTLLSFTLMRLSPVDPAAAYVMRNSPIVTTEQIAEARIELGLDKPLAIQYFTWVRDALGGEFGISLASGKPVLAELSKSIPVSLCVVGLSAVLMMIGVLLFGCLQYLIRESLVGKFLTVLSIIGISIPAFYLALLFIQYFAFQSDFISVTGNTGLMKYLPAALCLSVGGIAFYSQMLAGSLEREMNEDYAFFARCRGLKEGRILLFHALSHSVIDLVPNFAQMIGLCLAAAAIVERVFSLPGLGYLIIDSVINRDAPLIHASVLFLAIMLVLLDFAATILQWHLRRDIRTKEAKE